MKLLLFLYGLIGFTAAQPTILNVVNSNLDTFSTLRTALELTDLLDRFNSPWYCGTPFARYFFRANQCLVYTVFAPTDTAFSSLPSDVTTKLTTDSNYLPHLEDVLLYHLIVGSAILANQVPTGTALIEMANEESATFTTNDGGVQVNDISVINPFDIEARNGVVHTIGEVLLPRSIRESVVDVALQPNFSLLVAALSKANLVDALADPSATLTVFAPTDDAFRAIGISGPDDLPDVDVLTNILLYHVLGGVVATTESLHFNGMPKETLQGQSLTLDVFDSIFIGRKEVVVNNDVNVVKADILANNGVVHVIDAVLIPEGIPSEEQDILSILSADPDFSLLVQALTMANLLEALGATEGPFTVFAPTNAGFATIGVTSPDLLPQPGDAEFESFVDTLVYHVLEGDFPSSSLTSGIVQALNGDNLSIDVTQEGIVLNQSTRVAMADVEATNGRIHVINGILIPYPTIADLARGNGLTVLLELLQRAGVTLPVDQKVTLFAPTNDALIALGTDAVDSLESQGVLDEFLFNHVVGGNKLSFQLGSSETTLAGQTILVSMNPSGSFVYGAGNTINTFPEIVTSNIVASDGVIHIIDGVIVP